MSVNKFKFVIQSKLHSPFISWQGQFWRKKLTGLGSLNKIKKGGCHAKASHLESPNYAQSVATVLRVHSLIGLQATRKPLTHMHVTVVCVRRSASETHELFTQTQAHTRIPVSNRCARPCEPWTWIPSSGTTGRPRVKRDTNGTWRGRPGLKHTFQRRRSGYKAKGLQQWHSRNV